MSSLFTWRYDKLKKWAFPLFQIDLNVQGSREQRSWSGSCFRVLGLKVPTATAFWSCLLQRGSSNRMLKPGTKQQNQHTENLGTVRFCGYAAQEMKQVERRTRDNLSALSKKETSIKTRYSTLWNKDYDQAGQICNENQDLAPYFWRP